jgi:hypothetical protein
LAPQEQTGLVRIVITEIGWDGSIRRGALDISRLIDAGHWENLIEQVLAVPPPYRATPGSAVYVIHAGDCAVLVGEENLLGSLQELVTTIVAAADGALAAHARTGNHSPSTDASLRPAQPVHPGLEAEQRRRPSPAGGCS